MPTVSRNRSPAELLNLAGRRHGFLTIGDTETHDKRSRGVKLVVPRSTVDRARRESRAATPVFRTPERYRGTLYSRTRLAIYDLSEKRTRTNISLQTPSRLSGADENRREVPVWG